MDGESAGQTGELLRPAVEVFWSKGYGAASMQDIIDATGANRAQLYADYGDKRAVFIAALELYIDYIRDVAFGTLAGNRNPLKGIRQFLLFFAKGACEGNENRGCLLNNTAVELGQNDPEIGAIIDRTHREVEALLAEVVADAQQKGFARADLNPRETAKGLLATAIGLSILVRTRRDYKFLKSIADEAIGRLS